MLTLSISLYQKARAHLRKQGRPLDAALAAFHFDGASPEPALEALAAYQNPDGGFGHGLEADVRSPVSSAVATAIGLRTLHSLGAAHTHPMVHAAVGYLVASYDAAQHKWAIVPPEVNNDPHAPWWNYDHWAGKAATESEFNPTAEVLACLHRYPQGVSGALLLAMSGAIQTRLEATPDPVEMHDLACCVRLAEALPGGLAQRFWRRVITAVGAAVKNDPEGWLQYSPQPLHYVSSPASPLYVGLAEMVAANLDFRIQAQAPDGSWLPNWSWGGEYPDAWPQARSDWASALTLENLLLLRAFDRIG